MVYYFDEETNKIFKRLMQYPNLNVSTEKTLKLSRNRIIRELNKKEKMITIKKGSIMLNPKLKIKQKKNGFEFKIF